MAFLWTVSSPIAGTEQDFCKPMVEHELDRRVRSRLGSTLKGPCATEIQAHNREIGEPCLRDGRGSALAKNPSTSPRCPDDRC